MIVITTDYLVRYTSILCILFYLVKMTSIIAIYEMFDHKTNGPLSLPVISILQSWGLIANNNVIKCNKGHFLVLCPSTAYCDGFVWRCKQSYTNSKKKKVKCDFYQSIRKNTFFSKSHLSIYQIVTFAYLWTEKVSLEFIRNQIDIARQSSVDWASFHREVVFDGMILRHQKIGK